MIEQGVGRQQGMSRGSRSVYIAVGILVLGVVAGGGYWLLSRGGDPNVRLMRAVSTFSVTGSSRQIEDL
jgi:hypothetical protein